MSHDAPKSAKAKATVNPDNLYADGAPAAPVAEQPAATSPEALAVQPAIKPDNLYADSSPKD